MSTIKDPTQVEPKHKKPEIPIEKNGRFTLPRFLEDRDHYLEKYPPSSTFIGVCLIAILNLESVYERLDIARVYGDFGQAIQRYYEDDSEILHPQNLRMMQIAHCFESISAAIHGLLKENSSWNPRICLEILPLIGWLICDAGIDIEAIKSQVKKSSTRDAIKARLNKSEILIKKIGEHASYWIAKYPEKPATEIYMLMLSDLSNFARANGITRGLSKREVIGKISKVKKLQI